MIHDIYEYIVLMMILVFVFGSLAIEASILLYVFNFTETFWLCK